LAQESDRLHRSRIAAANDGDVALGQSCGSATASSGTGIGERQAIQDTCSLVAYHEHHSVEAALLLVMQFVHCW
jgi:hypothetical protein